MGKKSATIPALTKPEPVYSSDYNAAFVKTTNFVYQVQLRGSLDCEATLFGGPGSWHRGVNGRSIGKVRFVPHRHPATGFGQRPQWGKKSNPHPRGRASAAGSISGPWSGHSATGEMRRVDRTICLRGVPPADRRIPAPGTAVF